MLEKSKVERANPAGILSNHWKILKTEKNGTEGDCASINIEKSKWNTNFMAKPKERKKKKKNTSKAVEI